MGVPPEPHPSPCYPVSRKGPPRPNPVRSRISARRSRPSPIFDNLPNLLNRVPHAPAACGTRPSQTQATIQNPITYSHEQCARGLPAVRHPSLGQAPDQAPVRLNNLSPNRVTLFRRIASPGPHSARPSARAPITYTRQQIPRGSPELRHPSRAAQSRGIVAVAAQTAGRIDP